MSNVDISKIRVGDVVTIRATVSNLDPLDVVNPIETREFGWVTAASLVGHEQRALAVGDKVRICGDPRQTRIIRAIVDDKVVVQHPVGRLALEPTNIYERAE